MTLYSHAESNINKTWMYLFFFFVLTILVGAVLSYFLDSYFILLIAVVYSVFMSFLSYWYSDKIVLAVSRARPAKKEDNPELYRLVENLCITAGLPLPKIYILPESQPNAFATGRDPKHAVVAVTQGLLERLERAELEGVLAHELAHVGNRDTLLQTIVVVLVGVIAVSTDIFIRVGFYGGFSNSDNDRQRGNLGAIMLVLAIVFVVLAVVAANLIKLAISRKREFLADASGALLTRYPEGLARALQKISQNTSPLRAASNATSHLYIANPLRGKGGSSWFSRLFMTHPPIEERIRALSDMKLEPFNS